MILLGGPVFGDTSTPEAWVAAVASKGYRAAYCPLDASASADAVRAYEEAARAAGIAIAEVGAWSNPLSDDATTATTALEHCKRQLDLADRIGARCCVNIAGSPGEQWDGHHPDNLTEPMFERIVDCVRDIIDSVKPSRTHYSLETMPWMYPDSPESYARMISAIDRDRFAVHLDPVNLICSPQRYYATGALIRECFRLFGDRIVSCHAKDILLAQRLTTHLDEVRPGLGGLDYPTFLRELGELPADVPLMLEHLAEEAEYDAAAAHIRSVADREGVRL
ncbi:MAG TPA: TIM barrel protein [Chthonomonadales bacterium]|nr:TIM barrel protein [Chthonomonadales bacterium]